MTKKQRVNRLNSLLKEVISEVVTQKVRNPKVSPLVTVTQVEVSPDLQHAKVYVSVIGTEKNKNETIEALQTAAGFIAVHASKRVVLRYFPTLNFKLDTTVDKHLHIDAILDQIREQHHSRGNSNH